MRKKTERKKETENIVYRKEKKKQSHKFFGGKRLEKELENFLF